MIPIHDFVQKNTQAIRVVKLSSLTSYDTTEPHRHQYFELFIFDRGMGVHDIDFQPFPIQSASVHIVAPGVVHQVRRELDTNGYVILFDISAIDEHTPTSDFLYDHLCYDVSELSPIYLFEGELAQSMLDTAETLYTDYNSKKPLRAEFLKNHLNLICIHCMRNQQYALSPGVAGNQVYREFRKLLRSNFKTIKKVGEYADVLGLSEKKLNEIVSSKSGMSCSALIKKQIVLEAKRLLNTDLTAKEVAYELQFDDPAHFSKFFKTQTGQNPSQFQKVQVSR